MERLFRVLSVWWKRRRAKVALFRPRRKPTLKGKMSAFVCKTLYFIAENSYGLQFYLMGKLYLTPMTFNRRSKFQKFAVFSSWPSFAVFYVVGMYLVTSSLIQIGGTLVLFASLEDLTMAALLQFQSAMFCFLFLASWYTMLMNRHEVAEVMNLTYEMPQWLKRQFSESAKTRCTCEWYKHPAGVYVASNSLPILTGILAYEVTSTIWFRPESLYSYQLLKWAGALEEMQYQEVLVWTLVALESLKQFGVMMCCFQGGAMLVVTTLSTQAWLKQLKLAADSATTSEDIGKALKLFRLVERITAWRNRAFSHVHYPSFGALCSLFTIFVLFFLFRGSTGDPIVDLLVFVMFPPVAAYMVLLVVLIILQFSMVKIRTKEVSWKMNGVCEQVLAKWTWTRVGRASEEIQWSKREKLKLFGVKIGSFGYVRPALVVYWVNGILSILLVLLTSSK